MNVSSRCKTFKVDLQFLHSSLEIQTGRMKLYQDLLLDSNVTAVDLTNSIIGVNFTTQFAKFLPETQIKSLDLTCNDVQNAGFFAICDVLPDTQITRLVLKKNTIDGNGVKYFCDVLPQTRITEINFAGKFFFNFLQAHEFEL
jgi:hypothetical protein